MSALVDLMDSWLKAKEYNMDIRDLEEYKTNDPMKIIILEFDKSETDKVKDLLSFFAPPVYSDIEDNEPVKKANDKPKVNTNKKTKLPGVGTGGNYVFGTKTAICDYKPCSKEYKALSNAQKYCSDKCRLLDRGLIKPEITPIIAPEKSKQNQQSFFHKKKMEEIEAAEERKMLESLQEHPKIDWKKAKSHPKTKTDDVAIL
jgi:hypothetical protein